MITLNDIAGLKGRKASSCTNCLLRDNIQPTQYLICFPKVPPLIMNLFTKTDQTPIPPIFYQSAQCYKLVNSWNILNFCLSLSSWAHDLDFRHLFSFDSVMFLHPGSSNPPCHFENFPAQERHRLK